MQKSAIPLSHHAVMAVAKEHSGACGMDIDYACTMVHKAEERVKHSPTLAVPIVE